MYEDYIQYIAGRIYYHPSRGFPVESVQAHESVHDWQQRTDGRVRFVLRYFLSRRARQHYEAMAYAHEVAFYHRPADNAVQALTAPAYRMGWDRDAARALLDVYVEAFRATP